LIVFAPNRGATQPTGLCEIPRPASAMPVESLNLEKYRGRSLKEWNGEEAHYPMFSCPQML